MNYSIKAVAGIAICLAQTVFAQDNKPTHSITGNFQVDGANYSKDTVIGADPGSQVFRYNAFGNVNYVYGNFSAGVRFESYQPPLLGFLPGYAGTGIPYKYARYKHENIDITVGSYYDQFGSGLCFRSFEDRGLLYDNAMNGMRVIFTPKEYITLKGVVGRQRTYFDLSPGVVRGIDGEVNLTQWLNEYRGGSALTDSGTIDSARMARPLRTQVILGGSFVSKFQTDQDPALVLPENVGCSAARLSIMRGGFNFFAEGAYKINDPSYQNGQSYKDGKGIYTSVSFASNMGLTFLVTAKFIDNMSFRSDRSATNTIDLINYSPPITKNHTYMMLAYVPYATQMNGEIGGSAEIQYKFKKGTALGGKYGMDISVNGSLMHAPDTTALSYAEDSVRHYKYKTNYSALGDKLFHDFNIEINRKLSKKVKLTAIYSTQFINQAWVQYNTLGKKDHPDVNAHIGVLDVTWRYKTGKALRFETQGYFTRDTVNAYGIGSWFSGLIEWTPSSNWFIILADQYNYGYNSVILEANNNLPAGAPAVQPVNIPHYYYAGLVYVTGPTRISLSYGRQRAGIFCAGGVCRFVPAANALTISVSSSF